MKHRLAFFFIALLSCLSISAQKFELDPLWGDSIECMVASKPDSLWKISEPIQSVKFPKGMEIESCGKANGYYVAFKKDGASYMAYMGDLKFSADNPEGTVNPLSEDTVKKHSALGHFYATYTPAVLVLILMGMILATFFVARKSSPAVPLALKVIPVCMLLISIIEVVGYKVLGGDMFWWCDNDRYGFFGSLFRVIPFGAVVALQFYTFKMFETLVFADVPAEEKGKLSLKPAMVSLAACLPVLIAYAMIVQLWLGDGKRCHHVHPFLGHFGFGYRHLCQEEHRGTGCRQGLDSHHLFRYLSRRTFDSSLGSYHRASEAYPSGADGHSRYHRPFCFGTAYLL